MVSLDASPASTLVGEKITWKGKQKGVSIGSHGDTLRHAQLAADTGEAVFGVKGTSPAQGILQVPEMLLYNYMHQVIEGEFTRRMNAWLAGKCSSNATLKPSKGDLTNNLLNVSLPHDYKRTFRSLQEFKHWKASEKQTLFLHAVLPLLKCFSHHSLLVTGVRLLCEDSITSDDIHIHTQKRHRPVTA